MCGIAGKLYFAKDKEVTVSQVEKMTESIKHRGPDDDGVYISPDKTVGLGHRRLSIIDLSPLGHQPMNYLNRYWIVFNGEIYNYLDEKSKLEKFGYNFSSHSDTEVIMALYDKYGFKCLDHLRGMFSFAIYDEKEKTIFCARDRVGKKPFKYYTDDNVFIFASELKAILTQKEYKKEPDFEAIYHYLTLQYVPSPLTGFVGIKKLEPAHYLFIDIKTRKLIKRRYWKLNYKNKLNLSETEWKKRIISKLRESVKIRMLASDVPVGAFLSGGTDSSAIVAMMSSISNAPVKTYTISFDEEEFDESKYAEMISKEFHTDHTIFSVKPDAIRILPLLVKQYEEPYADSSALPTYYLSKLTRKGVTVALNGDGGDENFGGYERYSIQKIALFLEKFGVLNTLFFKPISRMIFEIIPTVFTERLARLFCMLNWDYRERFVGFSAYFTEKNKSHLYKNKPNLNTYKYMSRFFNQSKFVDKLDNTMYGDFSSYLPECLLSKVDIATMSVSLEGRSPFLDHEFLELTAQIPNKLKIKGINQLKHILKESFRGLIPDEVMDRPKRGFSVPIQKWFKNDLNNYIRNILLSKKSKTSTLFDQNYIREMIDNHTNGKENYGHKLWALLTLELWFREYFS
ncbi:MAG: asparagine synthase (glutamine-hydrolyzing) [Microgenomates group bacterium]